MVSSTCLPTHLLELLGASSATWWAAPKDHQSRPANEPTLIIMGASGKSHLWINGDSLRNVRWLSPANFTATCRSRPRSRRRRCCCRVEAARREQLRLELVAVRPTAKYGKATDK